MKRVLLHICCGPCAIYPFENLAREGYRVEGFFYNPNIQPQPEYLKRREAVAEFGNKFGAKVHFVDCQEKDYIDCASSAKDKTSRCRSCFNLRLKQAHKFAINSNFNFFTSTLLVSPYQDQQMIKEVGSQISQNSNTKFLFCDFRPGFREAHSKARELNLYCQKYCGCLSSLDERNKERKARKVQC